ncbi:hypothetical protein BDV95DRAFT_587047 [Massariosphaeria phaeospora]|uniref:Uncharacterized protein n=1 Tax=Massariosphaeria phaeospora TaxID=100035 RepID=A0A7C8M1H0_9PLEO|nr:hypothetical protein BDV95DRAFT_587047 [Massariosphaeria phaeospora]
MRPMRAQDKTNPSASNATVYSGDTAISNYQRALWTLIRFRMPTSQCTLMVDKRSSPEYTVDGFQARIATS